MFQSVDSARRRWSIFFVNNVTLKTEPCRTPSSWLNLSKDVSSTLTLKVLFDRNSFIYRGNFLRNPILCRSFIMPYFHVVSYASLRLKVILFFYKRSNHEESFCAVTMKIKTSEWRKECCKEWRAWMSIWASPCPSKSPSAEHLPAAVTLRVSVWTQH